MFRLSAKKLVALGVGASGVGYLGYQIHNDQLDIYNVGVARFGRAATTVRSMGIR